MGLTLTIGSLEQNLSALGMTLSQYGLVVANMRILGIPGAGFATPQYISGYVKKNTESTDVSTIAHGHLLMG